MPTERPRTGSRFETPRMSIDNNGGAGRNMRKLVHGSFQVTDGERLRPFYGQMQSRFDEPLFDRNARRGRARIGPQLVVDRGQVRVDHARADNQPLSYLREGRVPALSAAAPPPHEWSTRMERWILAS